METQVIQVSLRVILVTSDLKIKNEFAHIYNIHEVVSIYIFGINITIISIFSPDDAKDTIERIKNIID